MPPPETLAIAALALTLAGLIKGISGLGLPTTALGLMTLAIEPRVAIAIILFPMLVSNLWQALRVGDVGGAISRYRGFALSLVAVVTATAALTGDVDERWILAALGSVILIFVAISLAGRLPEIPQRWDGPAQIAAGALTGVIGGLTAGWAAPLAMYLNARRVPPDEFIRASGLLIFLGSLPLALVYLQLGFLTAELALTSALGLLPTLIGQTLGERVRRRISVHAFRQVIVWVLFFLALNLLRRAAFG